MCWERRDALAHPHGKPPSPPTRTAAPELASPSLSLSLSLPPSSLTVAFNFPARARASARMYVHTLSRTILSPICTSIRASTTCHEKIPSYVPTLYFHSLRDLAWRRSRRGVARPSYGVHFANCIPRRRSLTRSDGAHDEAVTISVPDDEITLKPAIRPPTRGNMEYSSFNLQFF